MSRFRLLALIAAFVGVMALALAACGDDDDDDGGGGGTIALLLPESHTARYESQDKPNFEKKVKELCSDCDLIYSNAGEDVARQQQQADAASAGAIATKAKAQQVPIVSYDRLILDADLDYYISYDNANVGKLQGESLVKKLEENDKGDGTIVMINGDPADNNAKLFKQGATGVFDNSDLKVGKSYDTPGWLGKNAQQEMEQAITALGKDGFVGVYAANDTTAGAAIAAMKSAGIDPATRPTTGQDAELAGIQRILSGEQFMTVYKDLPFEAEDAATLAVALAKGDKPPAGLINGKVDNGQEQVPSVLRKPVEVTKDNIQDTIIKDGFWSPKQICTGKYASACEEAGIQ